MTRDQLQGVLTKHGQWLRDEKGGKRADLSGADLSGAKWGAHAYANHASLQFGNHGECGRQLLAIETTGGILLSCGCFSGSPDDLRAYIANDPKNLRRTRTIAFDTILMLLAVRND